MPTLEEKVRLLIEYAPVRVIATALDLTAEEVEAMLPNEARALAHLMTRVSETGASTRLINILHRGHILYVWQVPVKTATSMRRLSGMGKKTFNEIYERLLIPHEFTLGTGDHPLVAEAKRRTTVDTPRRESMVRALTRKIREVEMPAASRVTLINWGFTFVWQIAEKDPAGLGKPELKRFTDLELAYLHPKGLYIGLGKDHPLIEAAKQRTAGK